MYQVDRESRITEVQEFFGYPRELVETLFKYSKEYYEGVWHAFEEMQPYYYGAGFYAIRQMSYTQEQVFPGYIREFLDNMQPGETAQDVGCGVGDNLIYLAKRGVKCYATEHQGLPVEFLKYRFKKHGVTAEITHKLVQTDYKLFLSSLDHLDDPVAVAEYAAHTTRKRILASPCIDETYDRPAHDKRILKHVPEAFRIINEHNARKS